MTDDVLERFWSRVDRNAPGGCWLWRARITGHGYGEFYLGQEKRVRAHRFAYQVLVGPIPEGLGLDHLCRVRHCVNPAHLEPVTQRVNLHRGYSSVGINARKTHCKQGHEFTPENTRVRPSGARECRKCRRKAKASYRARRGGGTDGPR